MYDQQESSIFIKQLPGQENQQYFSQLGINLVTSLLFAVEFGQFFILGFALEITYITPFFVKLETPALLDSLVWLIPVLLLLAINPIFKYWTQGQFQRNKYLMISMATMTIVGMLLLAYADKFGEWWYEDQEIQDIHKIRRIGLVLGLAGFLLSDLGFEVLNEISLDFLGKYVPEESSASAMNAAFWWGNCGKILGFTFGALPVFGFQIKWQHLHDNMSFSYIVGICFYVFILASIVPLIKLNQEERSIQTISRNDADDIDPNESMSLRKQNRKLRNQSIQDNCENQLNLNSFFPEITNLSIFPLEVKILLCAHFFCMASYIMVLIYATSWVGISVLDGIPDASKFSLRRKIFDSGVSWGAFALLSATCLSIIFLLSSGFLKKYFSPSQLLGFTHILSSLALLSTLRLDELSSVFIIIPLCGFSFASINTMPNLIAEQLEQKLVMECNKQKAPHCAKTCVYSELPEKQEATLHMPVGYEKGAFIRIMSLSTLMAQVFMLSVVPSLFLMFPYMDDNIWGLATAGISGAIGAFFCFLL